MAKVVVAGVDGSDTALRAARRAAEVAWALGAELHVLSAYGKFEVETFTSGEEEVVFTSLNDAARTSSRVIAALRQDFPSLSITSAPSEGKPGEALVKAAERLDADLVVVGNRRVQGLGRVLGSVARDVASRAKCDVYVVNTTVSAR